MAAANPLEYAIQMERDGRAFYDDAAAATTNPLGKRMFEGLAARLCCRHASRADLQELTELAAGTHKLGSEGNADFGPELR